MFVDDGSPTGRSQRSHGCTTHTPTCGSSACAATWGRLRRSTPGSGKPEGDAVVTIDGDLQDDPAEIPRLLAKLDEGYDLVTAGRRSGATRSAARAVEDLQRIPGDSRASACTT